MGNSDGGGLLMADSVAIMGEMVKGWRRMSYPPIFIPVVNRLDLLRNAVNSVPDDDRWGIEIINNTGESIPPDILENVINPQVPQTAAQSLNLMQKLAEKWEVPFYFFMHNDAEAEPGTVEGLYQMARAKTKNGDKWGVIFTYYDTLAAYNTAAFAEVGPWDQNLPQYFTDNDMYRRMRLAGYELAESHLPVKHVGSQTIHSDPIRRQVNAITFPIYERYYQFKWGGGPGQERYERPFNQ
jgi:hypothetical protein